MAEPHKRNRHPRYRTGYRVKNWAEYEAALRQRGSITFWLNDDVIAGWKPPPNGKRGAQAEYSDLAIQTCIVLRLLFHQPLRQTEGFVASIFEMMNLSLSVPDHTTLSRRGKHIDIDGLVTAPGGPVDLIVDSTGLGISNSGRWSEDRHGTKRKGWRKLHLGVDGDGTIIVGAVTDETVPDAQAGVRMINAIDDPIAGFTEDGAYDQQPVYAALCDRVLCDRGLGETMPTIVVPPRKSALPSDGTHPSLTQRDAHISRIRRLGRVGWRKASGYYRQSHVENAFSRYKRTFGGALRSRHPQAQKIEAAIACSLLNQMRADCRSESYPVL